MKQLIQNLRTGEFDFEEIPAPALKAGGVIVRTSLCLIHAGALLPASAVADAQPGTTQSVALATPPPRQGLVRRLWSSFRKEGVKSAYQTFAKRNASVKAIEYVGVGTVLEAAPGVKLRPGARIAWVGFGMFPPSEIAFAAARSCIALPKNVGDEAAAYVLPGGVALRAVRRAQAQIGSCVGVFGESLVAQLAIRLFHASGCRVLTAESPLSGDEEPVIAIVVASDAPDERWIERAARTAASGARVVVCGDIVSSESVAKLRAKEAKIMLSWSGGGGVGDPLGEALSVSSPSPSESMRDFLAMIEADFLTVDGLTSHRFDLERAKSAFDIFFQKKDTLGGILIAYPSPNDAERRRTRFDVSPVRQAVAGSVGVGFVGTESQLGQRVLPMLVTRGGSSLTGVANATGESARAAAADHAFEYCSTEFRDLLADGKTNAVFVGAPARIRTLIALEYLKSRVAVYVESPPCVSDAELRDLGAAVRASDAFFMIGFARRFSPIAREFKRRVGAGDGPACITYRISGTAESFGWREGASVLDLEMTLELSEFFDFAQFLADGEPTRVMAHAVHRIPNSSQFESVSASVAFSNGTIAHIFITLVEDEKAIGERIEYVSAGAFGFLENFLSGEITRNGVTERVRVGVADFGHRASMEAFFTSLAKPEEPSPTFRTSSGALMTAFRLRESLETGQPVRIILP